MASPQNESQTHWADALPVYDRDGPADYPEEKPAENLRKRCDIVLPTELRRSH